MRYIMQMSYLYALRPCFSPWAKTPKIAFFVPIAGTSANIDFFNLHLLKFMKIYDINAESVAYFVKWSKN